MGFRTALNSVIRASISRMRSMIHEDDWMKENTCRDTCQKRNDAGSRARAIDILITGLIQAKALRGSERVSVWYFATCVKFACHSCKPRNARLKDMHHESPNSNCSEYVSSSTLEFPSKIALHYCKCTKI